MSYWLGSDKFHVDQLSGIVTVSGALDRETKQLYKLVVYAAEGLHYSTVSLHVNVLDVNDHPPKFPACYSLSVPENNDFGVIHRLQAYDPDSGPNAEITYTITGNLLISQFIYTYFIFKLHLQ